MVHFELHEANANETGVISFSRETKLLGFEYQLYESPVTRTDSIKYLRVFIYYKLHFHHHVDHVFSQTIKVFDFIRTFSFLAYRTFCCYVAR
jgi:hypothetical protein